MKWLASIVAADSNTLPSGLIPGTQVFSSARTLIQYAASEPAGLTGLRLIPCNPVLGIEGTQHSWAGLKGPFARECQLSAAVVLDQPAGHLLGPLRRLGVAFGG